MILQRHWRFLAGLILGLIAVLLVQGRPLERLLVGGDVLFGFYLLTTWAVCRRMSAATLRAHARNEDEGAAVIFFIALSAVVVSLGAIFDVLSSTHPHGWERAAALISVPLGWATLHTLFAFRYAHLWYVPGDETGQGDPGRIGGLDFGPDTPEPGVIEFVYYSFTIGMTAQTSDTGATTTEMRRLTLWHAVVSFMYNTVLIALAVNAGFTSAGGG